MLIVNYTTCFAFADAGIVCEFYRKQNLQYLNCVNEHLDEDSAVRDVFEADFMDFLYKT